MPEQSQQAREQSRKRRERSGLRKPARIFEGVGGGLLCLLVAATPWLYGTTEEWSVRWMNFGTYIAAAFVSTGALLNSFRGKDEPWPRTSRERTIAYLFLGLNIAVLAFCAMALWNARATFSVVDQSFVYRDEYNPKLPTTYDAPLTRDTLLSLLACCALFWSIRSWIYQGNRQRSDEEELSILRNRRFQLLVWLMTLNGMAIAIQGILQRLSNSSKLLWTRESWWGTPIGCFGPFSYRGNAAEYLNLLWPLALGFWWVLSRERRRRQGSSRLFTDGPELLLIPATIIMLIACMITFSRGGTIIALGTILVIGVMIFAQKAISARVRIGFIASLVLICACAWYLGSKTIITRFRIDGLTSLSGREEIYRNAKQMAVDYPLFGTGPGTFRSVYHLYRQNSEELWHGFLHDDWMETRVTFGWVGLLLVVAHLLLLAFWIFMPGRPQILYVFSVCAGTALVGTLIHAKFDFPFQTYSILYTFVAIAALVVSISPVRR